MRFAVVGVGVVGSFFGGRLAHAGESVVFLARGANLRSIRERGLRIDSVDGDFVVSPAQATDQPAQVGPVDVVLLAVKAWQVPGAIETMRPLMGPSSFAVPLLDGVEAPGQLTEAFGAGRVVDGTAGMLGSVVEPGHVRNDLPHPYVTLGELDGSRTERVESLRRTFEHAGIRATLVADPGTARWQKLLLVGPHGGVGAVARVPIGSLRGVAETRELLVATLREVWTVARARGAALPDDAVEQTLEVLDRSPAHGLAAMQRDIMAGRPSELDGQIGAVIRLGRAVGVETPRHAFLYASLLPQERIARGELARAT